MRKSPPSPPSAAAGPLLLAAAAGVLMTIAPVSARAQLDAAVPTLSGSGDWVRVHTIPGTVYTGRLTSATTADTLYVATPPRRALRGMSAQSTWRTFPIATTSVRVLERGHDRGQAWNIGGTVLGAALGLAGGVAMSSGHSSGSGSVNAGGMTAVLTVGGAAAGLFLANATRLHFSPAPLPRAAATTR
jgi:hypothetical protein